MKGQPFGAGQPAEVIGDVVNYVGQDGDDHPVHLAAPIPDDSYCSHDRQDSKRPVRRVRRLVEDVAVGPVENLMAKERKRHPQIPSFSGSLCQCACGQVDGEYHFWDFLEPQIAK